MKFMLISWGPSVTHLDPRSSLFCQIVFWLNRHGLRSGSGTQGDKAKWMKSMHTSFWKKVYVYHSDWFVKSPLCNCISGEKLTLSAWRHESFYPISVTVTLNRLFVFTLLYVSCAQRCRKLGPKARKYGNKIQDGYCTWLWMNLW